MIPQSELSAMGRKKGRVRWTSVEDGFFGEDCSTMRISEAQTKYDKIEIARSLNKKEALLDCDCFCVEITDIFRMKTLIHLSTAVPVLNTLRTDLIRVPTTVIATEEITAGDTGGTREE